MWVFICHKLLIRFNLFWHAQTAWIFSFPLLLRIALKSTLYFFFYFRSKLDNDQHMKCCAVLLTLESRKGASYHAQNQSSVDESLKQGPVGCCPSPLHIRWVKAAFLNDWTLIYDTFIHQEEQLVPRVICNYAIFTSPHMRNTFQFRISIRSSVYMSSRSDYKRTKPPLTIRFFFNQIWPIQTDWHVYNISKYCWMVC